MLVLIRGFLLYCIFSVNLYSLFLCCHFIFSHFPCSHYCLCYHCTSLLCPLSLFLYFCHTVPSPSVIHSFSFPLLIITANFTAIVASFLYLLLSLNLRLASPPPFSSRRERVELPTEIKAKTTQQIQWCLVLGLIHIKFIRVNYV